MASWGMRPGSHVRWWAIALVGILAIVVVALVYLALQRGQPTRGGSTPTAVTTAAPSAAPSASTTASATPTPTPSTAPTVGARADQRLLTGNGSTLWRATAGECRGPAPVIERSADGGTSWTVVTPTYRGIAQVQTLDTLANTQAQLVGAVGQNCETQALRTFTQGQFWEPHAPTLANARYPEVAQPNRIVRPIGEIVAPCADPRSFRAGGDVLALVCDGTARSFTDGAWVTLPPAGARAVAIDGKDILVAHTSPTCTGIAVTRVAPDLGETPVGCAADASPATPVAITVVGSDTLVWSGDRLVAL